MGGGSQQFAVCSCVSKKAYIQVHPNNTTSYMLHTATATAAACHCHHHRYCYCPFPSRCPNKLAHGEQKCLHAHVKKRKSCRQRRAMAANGSSNMVEEELLPPTALPADADPPTHPCAIHVSTHAISSAIHVWWIPSAACFQHAASPSLLFRMVESAMPLLGVENEGKVNACPKLIAAIHWIHICATGYASV